MDSVSDSVSDSIANLSIKPKRPSFFTSLTHFWKDLTLLVLGIYLALWMENTVQDWENDAKQQDYLYRLAQDLNSDIQSLEYLQKKLADKVSKLEQAIGRIAQDELAIDNESTATFTLSTASTINNYFFFTPQDFTYLSMRESGDFKLIKEDAIKSRLIKLYGQYDFLATLQKNYLQGLDDEFIPLWLRSVDILHDNLIDKSLIKKPLYTNMIAFAYNDTQTRQNFIQHLLTQTRQLQTELIQQSHNATE